MTFSNWKDRPVPPAVRAWRHAEQWEWVSSHRLRAPHPWPGHCWIALVGDDGEDPIFAIVDESKGADHLAREWADLFETRARDLARQAACRDGVPPRATKDPARCSECGLLASEHDVPGTIDGPTRQETHVHWFGLGDMTTAEAEAALRLMLTDLATGSQYSQAFKQLDDDRSDQGPS